MEILIFFIQISDWGGERGRREGEERGGGEREGRGRREGRGGRGKTPAARKSKHSGNPVLSPSHGTTLLIGLQELSFLALLKTKILNVATQKLKKENEYKNIFFIWSNFQISKTYI